MEMTKQGGEASVYPSGGETSFPPAPPTYDAATGSNIHTTQPQFVATGPTIINTGPPVYQQGPTIITTQPVFNAVPVAALGASPTLTVCRVCNCQVMSRVDSEPSGATHLCACVLCFTALWPCVCLPYCMQAFYNYDHYCPNCSAHIGRSF